MKKKNRVYFLHILDAIYWIEEYTRGMYHDTFFENHLVQDGVLKQIEVIGEAAKHISSDVTDAYPAVPWNDMAGMRDFVVHNYFNVDVEAVFKTVIVDIPLLKEWITEILRDFKEP